jgi:hypothetical protein
MNFKAITSLTPITSKLAFGLACVLITGAGWGAKIGFDQFSSICDETSAGFGRPSAAFLRAELHRTPPPAFNAPTPPPLQLFPTNSAAPPIIM